MKILLKAAIVLGIVLVIVGIVVVFNGTEKTGQQKIVYNDFRFDGSSGLVLGRLYYLGGGEPQFYPEAGDTVEVRDVHPPTGFNGSLFNVYFAVWESAHESGSAPDELIKATDLPATLIATHGYMSFQLLSDGLLGDLASGSSWTVYFILPYTIPANAGPLAVGTAGLATGTAMITYASYRLVQARKSPRARRA